jgi:hypothetical protein
MIDYPDDVFAPSSLAQLPADVDLDQSEPDEAGPLGGLDALSRRLGQRLRNVTGTTRTTLRLMS